MDIILTDCQQPSNCAHKNGISQAMLISKLDIANCFVQIKYIEWCQLCLRIDGTQRVFIASNANLHSSSPVDSVVHVQL